MIEMIEHKREGGTKLGHHPFGTPAGVKERTGGLIVDEEPSNAARIKTLERKLEEYKTGLARLQSSLSACEDIRQRQKIDEYEEVLIDIARGFIDYDQTELCREGMMIMANGVILKFHKPTIVKAV